MLREATEADLGFVHGLFMDEIVNPFLSYDPMPLEEFAQVYEGLLGKGGSWFLKKKGSGSER